MVALDWLMIVLYFVLLAGLTWWSVAQSRNTADDYLLAGRDLGWLVIGASIFASNIGSAHLVGFAGAGATSGVSLAHYEWHAWCLLVLGWVLVPFLRTADHSGLSRCTDRGELCHAADASRATHRAHIRDGDARTMQASCRSWNTTDVASSAVVLAVIVAAYLYFNG
jgi:sodium:solute symporter family protein